MSTATKNLILQIQYNGSCYQGWQKQNNTMETVEQYLIKAFSQIAPNLPEPNINAAGRTDKGVHALSQIASIEILASDLRQAFKWKEGLNRFLPETIRILKAFLTHSSFHARYDASNREYVYIFDLKPSIFTKHLASPLKHDFDKSLLDKCAQFIVGTHDFQSFQGGSCQAQVTTKKIHYAYWEQQRDFLYFRVKACGFLHHMVRYLIACQMKVASGEESYLWFEKLFQGKVEHHYCAVSDGLYFVGAHYPKHQLTFSSYHPLISLS